MAEIRPTETPTNVWTMCEGAITLLDMISLQERLDGDGIVCIQFGRRRPTDKKQSCGAEDAVALRSKSSLEKKKMGPGFDGGLICCFGELPR